jgi:N-carbamoylputrescine amidase
MKTGYIQHQNFPEPETNIRLLMQKIRECAQQDAELVVLPELHNTRYFCQTEDAAAFDFAEPVPGPSTDRYGLLAKELHVVIVLSLFERRAPGLYHNTAVVIEKDGTIAGIHRKMHIPDDPGYCEKYYFTPGDTPPHPIATSVGKLGILICWDQWFPEAARLMALHGADILLCPTAIGYEIFDYIGEQVRQRNAWQMIQRAHAIANGIPLVAVNRTGFEPHPTDPLRGIQFWGNSFVAGQQGELLNTPYDSLEILRVVDIDLSRTETVRRAWPFLRDRRIDTYGDLTQRWLDK